MRLRMTMPRFFSDFLPSSLSASACAFVVVADVLGPLLGRHARLFGRLEQQPVPAHPFGLGDLLVGGEQAVHDCAHFVAEAEGRRRRRGRLGLFCSGF